MENLETENICPRCGSSKMKSWSELSDEQKFLVERLPKNVEYSSETRKKHRFCTQCWFEESERKDFIG